MKHGKYSDVVSEGKQVLATKLFPGDLIERIKEPRLRRDISKQIFKADKQISELRPAEKKWRLQLLKVQYVFTDYLSAAEKYRPTGVFLVFLSVLTIGTSLIGLNENLIFGWVTLIQGVVIIVISLNYNNQLNTLNFVAFVFMGSLVLEPIIFGIPYPYIQYFYPDNVLQTKVTGVVAMFNYATPYMYLAGKLTSGVVILYYAHLRRNYLKLKLELETKLGQ